MFHSPANGATLRKCSTCVTIGETNSNSNSIDSIQEIKDPPIKKIILKLALVVVVVIYSLYFVKVYGAMTIS